MPIARSRPPLRPTVRLRPVPPLDPPFDDEYAPTWPLRPAARPDGAPPVPVLRPDAVAPGRTDGAPPVPAALADATPEARHAARRFLATCLEIVNGYRPARHVRPLSSPADAAGIVEQLASATTRISARPRPGQPARTVRLQRLRVCEPRPGVAEAAAAVGVAGRTWAVAFRIERRRGSWVGVSVKVL